jgi:hypothetical protein
VQNVLVYLSPCGRCVNTLLVQHPVQDLWVLSQPNLGLATKARGYKVTSQENDLGITSHAPWSAKECEGMNPHTPK